ncbi:DUF805 domain-containing protein [Pseudoclavibacter sp. RFBA6]|uniref:DUF805 domain-containing protein n=1 Tax=Pseudoclavibacter sp. RFBA6 TaxID=2080573 RepID=UPI000CE8ED7F|nr:DUF805 domain-containing protein [Pseudoclavibacter sp. RFBA6]PPG38707.1 DUF805 domain-containing protein [Pseudoclavibacter sp. RFBA6]
MSTPQLDAPLYPPLYGASFGQAVKRFFKKYAVFSGRASRSEYWWWWLFGVLVNAVFFLIGSLLGGPGTMDSSGQFTGASAGYTVVSVIQGIWGLAILIPGFALLFRRLHDTNRSGWWWLIGLIPLVGAIVLLVFVLGSSRPEGARFDTQ